MNQILTSLLPLPPIKRIGFEDVKHAIRNQDPKTHIINTLPLGQQTCLLPFTLPVINEETTINYIMDNQNMNSYQFIIYGKNSVDSTAEQKYKQLVSLGFHNVFIYMGGMFEWLLLQDIYGDDEFPTTTKVLDILQYRPERTMVKN